MTVYAALESTDHRLLKESIEYEWSEASDHSVLAYWIKIAHRLTGSARAILYYEIDTVLNDQLYDELYFLAEIASIRSEAAA